MAVGCGLVVRTVTPFAAVPDAHLNMLRPLDCSTESSVGQHGHLPQLIWQYPAWGAAR